MKNINLSIVIGAVMCVLSVIFGFYTINANNVFKGVLWMIAALCWASFVRNVFRRNNRDNNRKR